MWVGRSDPMTHAVTRAAAPLFPLLLLLLLLLLRRLLVGQAAGVPLPRKHPSFPVFPRTVRKPTGTIAAFTRRRRKRVHYLQWQRQLFVYRYGVLDKLPPVTGVMIT